MRIQSAPLLPHQLVRIEQQGFSCAPLACIPDWCDVLTIGLKRDSRQLSKYIAVLNALTEGHCWHTAPANGIRVNICESVSPIVEHSTYEYNSVFS